MRGVKVLTRDYRPPLQNGAPIWTPDQGLPYTLPAVDLNTSNQTCGAGWNFTRTLADAIPITGFWPDGRPAVAFHVEADDALERGAKCRAASLTLTRMVEPHEWETAVREWTATWCVPEHLDRMVAEQLAWADALARPERDRAAVEDGLIVACEARRRDWTLREYQSARAAQSAQSAWSAWSAWLARSARSAWAAQSAWAAWSALTVTYAALNHWTDDDPMLLTTGIRDAYHAGLGIAVPVADGVLGWAMEATR